MPAFASPEGTLRYAERMRDVVAPGHFRLWPPAERSVNAVAGGLAVAPAEPPAATRAETPAGAPAEASAGTLRLSSMGMGTYLGPATDAADREYAESVAEAARSGVNVFDCAINYRHMRSERVLGGSLRALFQAGETARDEILVMTKGGYFPFDGQAPRDVANYFRRTYLDPGILTTDEVVAGIHCIAPRYLEDQLQRSLDNLGLDGIDVYFLHNPEQQLDEVSEEVFRDRMADAFAFLEKQVVAGRIARYGLATWNGFRVSPGTRGHLSLEALLALARIAGGDGHHFEVIELPFNPGMPEALTTPTQTVEGEAMPLLEAAARAGLMVVTSVPLVQGRILPHIPATFAAQMPGLDTPAQRAIQFARSTPGVLAPVVGMRSRPHVTENSGVARTPPLSEREFFKLFG